MSAQVIQVIETNLLRRGTGTPNDPIRCVRQFWDFGGRLLWEDDNPTRQAVIARVDAAINRYDDALVKREHGDVAADRCIREIREAIR